jgi:hypothetical protein
MTVSFNPLKANGQTFSCVPELDDLEVSLSNDNARDVLQALSIDDLYSTNALAHRLLQGRPRRRPPQAPRPRLARHPPHRDS